MDVDSDRRDEWAKLLESGDAVSLITVFRETSSCSVSCENTLLSISEFLESCLFQSALKVDMHSLFSATESPTEVTMEKTEEGTLDSREVLTELLSIGSIKKGRALVAYLRVTRATLRQLFLDTLRRRRRSCGSISEQLRMTRTVLGAWFPEVEKNVCHCAASLTLRDATPELVRTTNTLDGRKEGKDIANSDESTEEDDHSECCVSDYRFEALEALSHLVLDIVYLVGDTRKTVPLLLLLRATVEAAQPYTENSTFLRRSVSNLKDWSFKVCPATGLKSRDVPITSGAEGVEAPVDLGDVKAIREAITQALLQLIPEGELVTFLSEHVGDMFHGDLMESLSYDDSERGLDPRSNRLVATIHDLKRERESIYILSDEDDEGEPTFNGEGVAPVNSYVSLQRVGAMFLLCDLMATGDSCSCLLFSNSPQTLLFLAGPMILEAMKNSSLTVVMTGLTFLSIILTFVTPYSMRISGEDTAAPPSVADTANKDETGGSLKFSTRKFGLVFELLKSLISLSTTCPSEGPRVMARAVFTLMIQRCSFDLRLRTYSSFLVLTPFASVCSLVLHALRNEWSSGDWRADQSSGTNFLRDKLPYFLLQAQQSWLRRLQVSEASFVDPMVQSVNFVRCVIAEDFRQSSNYALFRHSGSEGKIRIPEAAASVERCSSWEQYLSYFFKNVASHLRKLAADTFDDSTPRMGVVQLCSLSPLDRFSLNIALDGVEERVEVFVPERSGG
ncbi:uncharacterized protein TEOVI_000612000 [Trypanosoma equiperdum]|uniref:Uncharacterized protein n=1 Tax=Trypanosoma equiperdum TaxID=5694 RepID=A0A1G4I7D7_TRYEQ|nr:hypothetical protein, conserved [Trypanosoma equiperdum]